MHETFNDFPAKNSVLSDYFAEKSDELADISLIKIDYETKFGKRFVRENS